MFERCSLLFMVIIMTSSFLTQAHFPEYCAECEQEVWEQVPCSEVPTTVAPPPPPSGETTARPPTTLVYSTTEPAYPSSTIAPPPPPTDSPIPPSPYKKCYCECKLGCKEFCRKVATSEPKQPLTQISSIGESAPGGQVEFTHVHQRKYFPKYGGDAGSYGGLVGPVNGPKSYKPYPLVYEQAAAAASPASAVASSPAVANIAAPNYTLEELAQLLSSAYGGKKTYPASVPPPPRPAIQLQPAPVATPSVYYSPVPVYSKQVVPLVSKVPPAPKLSANIKYAASAVASSSSGLSVAKIKTPYEEKIVVATPSPIVEEVKAYSAPQTEAYPVVQSQTEAYPSITPIYPSVTESYPKDSYPSITESYPSQTESYQPSPVPQPQPEVKPYGAPESGPDKPSSTFDLAIDNYLKDFGYGNQGRGYADY
ncbi:leucine-rich repeat extensin-like protein 2 [Drosophila ficusphila]|uniref:leucine-rich repeat extensin-like protein 2 n=1 Tax=Drosophila ficusphila TaxID=30025 RepID=UPI0007E87B84|nr:leucine-rich repeat extensin-like protein 2 [Drosophila ficusphila]